MAKKAANTAGSAETAATAAAQAKKAPAVRAKKHLKAQAVGVAAAVEGFVNAIVSPLEGRVASSHEHEVVDQKAETQVAISHESISKLAYEFYLQRQGHSGSQADDWFQAEQALRSGAR